MKKAAVFILTCATCVFLLWYAGVDFSERGFYQAWFLACSLALSAVAALQAD
jgi:uncharacterized membrane protein YiaA